MLKQCLDYIFWLCRKFRLKHTEFKAESTLEKSAVSFFSFFRNVRQAICVKVIFGDDTRITLLAWFLGRTCAWEPVLLRQAFSRQITSAFLHRGLRLELVFDDRNTVRFFSRRLRRRSRRCLRRAFSTCLTCSVWLSRQINPWQIAKSTSFAKDVVAARVISAFFLIIGVTGTLSAFAAEFLFILASLISLCRRLVLL